MAVNRQKIAFFLIFLVILLFGFLIGRIVGVNQTNSYYHKEEVKEMFCSEDITQKLPEKEFKLENYSLDLNIS